MPTNSFLGHAIIQAAEEPALLGVQKSLRVNRGCGLYAEPKCVSFLLPDLQGINGFLIRWSLKNGDPSPCNSSQAAFSPEDPSVGSPAQPIWHLTQRSQWEAEGCVSRGQWSLH